jgi:hypothetical protein
MQQLKHVELGWRAMESILNTIVDAVNARAPVEGSGIRLEEKGDAGTIISAADKAAGSGGTGPEPWRITPNGEIAGWQLIQVVDDSTQLLYDKWVWGGSNFNSRPCAP